VHLVVWVAVAELPRTEVKAKPRNVAGEEELRKEVVEAQLRKNMVEVEGVGACHCLTPSRKIREAAAYIKINVTEEAEDRLI
jgi:hypothetical protein